MADLDWKDTNVGRIGSKEDHDMKHKTALLEPAWEGAGLEPGTKVWRIEHFHVVAVDPATYGQFHKGDSYIVLNTVGGDSKDEEALTHTIYYYLGVESSIDEEATAAYKTVELDDYFHGEPHQVRVVMMEEQDEFKALFGGTLTYLEGGIDSGLKHVKPEGHDVRMWQARRMKGKTTVIQVPRKKKCIHESDCYVLDTLEKIYVYNGSSASPFAKAAANDKAMHIENERASGAQATHDIDDGFWAALED